MRQYITFFLLLLFSTLTVDAGAATCQSAKDGRWSDADIWENNGIPRDPADLVVIASKVTADSNASFTSCVIEKGGELILEEGKTLTIGDAFSILEGGKFDNRGGTLNPEKETFTLTVAGSASASGTTRIRNCSIVFDSNQKLSSIYSNTPAADQMTNRWIIKKNRVLTMDSDAFVTSIKFDIEGSDAATFVIDAEGEKKPLTLKFADVPECGIKPVGQIISKGSSEYPVTVTSVNRPPANYFHLTGETNRANFEMHHTTVSYSRGLLARYYYGFAKLDNCSIMHTEPGRPAISLIGASGSLVNVLLKDCSKGVVVSSVYGRDIFADKLKVEECTGQSIELLPAKPCAFYLKDSSFDLSGITAGTGSRIISAHHNNTNDYYLAGSFEIPSVEISKIPPGYRFGAGDNLHLIRARLVVNEKSECNNLSIDALSGIEKEENLTVNGERAKAESTGQNAGILSYFPLDEGRDTTARDTGPRGTNGKINSGLWVSGTNTAMPQTGIVDPFISLYWPMDEGQGAFLYNKTPAGAGEHTGKLERAEWTEGRSGQGLKFRRENSSRVTIPAAGSYIDKTSSHYFNFGYGLSFSVWLNFADLKNQDIISVIGHTVRLSDKTLFLDSTGIFQPAENKWFHLAFCEDFTGHKTTIYVDGKKLKEIPGGEKMESPSVQDFKGINLGMGTFEGAMDEVKLYSRCLASEEIEAFASVKTITPAFILEAEKALSQKPAKDKKERYALEFNGKKTYIAAPGLMPLGELTFSCWIKPDVPYLDSSIIEQTAGNPPVGIRFGIDDRRLTAVFSPDKNTPLPRGKSLVADNAILQKGVWAYVSFTYSLKDGKAALYFNGIKIKEMAVENPVYYPAVNMTVSGVTPFPTQYGQFKGFIRDIKIYQRALSEAELLTLYSQSLPDVAYTVFATEEEKQEALSTCILKGKVVDADTRTPLEAQVYVKDGERYYISRENCYWGSFGSENESAFVATGSFELKVPPGTVTVKTSRGFEYLPLETTFNLKDGEKKELVIALKRLVDMPALNWYAGEHHAHSWGHGKGELYDKFASAKGWQYYADAQKAVGFNYVSHSAPWDGGDFKSTWTDRFICWPTVEDQISHIHAGHVTGGRDIVARMENLFKTGGQGAVQHCGADDLQPGQLAIAMALDKIDAWQVTEDDWYRYLNMGFKCAVAQGSDYYFTYPLRKYISQEYSRMPSLTWQNMMDAYENHATFHTTGPLVTFKVNGKEPGGNVILEGNKETELNFIINAWHIYGLKKIELIKNGGVEKTFTYTDKPQSVKEEFRLKAADTCWYLVKIYGEKGEFAGEYAFTSPVYVQFGNRPMAAKNEDIEHFTSYIEAYKKQLAGTDEKQLADAEKAITIYRALSTRPRTWMADRPILEIPDRPKELSDDPSLLIYLPFDEGRTEFAWDHSRNNLRIPLYDTRWAEGKRGGAVCLTNSHIPLGNLTADKGISFLAWFNIKELADVQVPFSIGYNLYGLQIQRAGFTWVLGGRTASGTPEWTPDRWYHIAITHDFGKGEVSFYLDGQLLGTYKNKGVTISDMDMNIGGWAHPYNHKWDFNGRLDEVKIYDRALSGGEVKSAYENPGPGTSADDSTARKPETVDKNPGSSGIFRMAVSKTDYRQNLYVYLKNTAGTPLNLNAEEIYLDGKKVAEGGRKDKKDVNWYDVSPDKGTGALWYDIYPNPVPPGKWARLGVRFFGTGETGEKISLKALTEEGNIIEDNLPVIRQPGLKFTSYAFSDKLDRLYLYVESENEKEAIKKILIDDTDVTGKATIRKIPADGKNLFFIEIKTGTLFAQGSYLFVRIEGTAETNGEMMRVIKPFFPVGIYGVEESSGEFREENLQECRDHLIDTVHADFRVPRAGRNLDILKKYGIKAIFDPEWGKNLPKVIEQYKDNSSVLAWYVSDEPEMYKDSGKPMRFLEAPGKRIQEFREMGPSYPTFFTHCPWHAVYYDYAGMVDISLLDDYPVSNADIKRVVTDMEEGQKACAPGPVWFALQAFNGPIFGGRHPLPDELEFMAYSVLGMGVKGIFYFNYGHFGEPCYGVGKPMDELDKLYEKGQDKLQRNLEEIKADAAKLWEKIKYLNADILKVRELLLKACPVQLAEPENPKVKTYALLAGSEAIVLFTVNQDYEYSQKGFIPRPVEKCLVKIRLPEWFSPGTLTEISQGRSVEKAYDTREKTVEFSVNDLIVGKSFILTCKP